MVVVEILGSIFLYSGRDKPKNWDRIDFLCHYIQVFIPNDRQALFLLNEAKKERRLKM